MKYGICLTVIFIASVSFGAGEDNVIANPGECQKKLAAQIVAFETVKNANGVVPMVSFLRHQGGGLADAQYFVLKLQYPTTQSIYNVAYSGDFTDENSKNVCVLKRMGLVLPPRRHVRTPDACVSEIEGAIKALTQSDEVFLKHYEPWDNEDSYGYKFRLSNGKGYNVAADKESCRVVGVAF